MSNPSTHVPLHPGQGTVCPNCRRQFDDAAVVCPDDHAPLVRVADAAEDPMVGRTLDGRFTILARLGAGSMGTVYRARQNAINRDIAIKILRSDRATDETAKARFLREARANSVLASPHTVTVFDFGQSESGEFYLAMEMLEGESLGQRLQRVRRLPVDLAVETARQALRSLAEAHAKGIIHRDLKPDNLFYARVKAGTDDAHVEEILKVLDFGIAKMIGGDDGLAMNAIETQAGTVFGTPRYMSPEQAQGKPLDARSDLYSLGVILYQMLTGRPPFTDNDAIVVMARHIKTAPKSPSEACPEARIPPDLEVALMRALAKDPAQRPETAEQMSAELARSLDLGAAAASGVRSVRPFSPVVAPPPNETSDGISTAIGPIDPGLSIPLELRPRRRARAIAIGAAAALAAAAATAVLVARPPRRAPTTIPEATATAASAQALSAPPTVEAPASAEPAGPAHPETPTIRAESLPKASTTRTRPPSNVRPPPLRPPPAAATTSKPAPPSQTAPTSSSRYGIFE